MLEHVLSVTALAQEELPCFLVSRDGRVLETSDGARRMVGARTSPVHTVADLFNLTAGDRADMLATRVRWSGSCTLYREEHLNVDVRLVASPRGEDVLVFVTVDLDALTRFQEELGAMNSQLTNMNRERAKQAGRLARALTQIEAQAHELSEQKEEISAQAEELQTQFEQLADANDRLVEANAELEERERVKSAFYANLSHEVRAPLNSIMGFTEDALDGLAGPLTPTLEYYLTNVTNSSKHLLHIVTEMLDLAKLQSGRAALELESVDVCAVIQELEALMAPLVKRRQQTFAVTLADGLPALTADRAKLYQILLNLASNANKYTLEGGELSLAVRLEHGWMRFDVRDTGIGIAPTELPYLFEEFRQIHRQRRLPGVQSTGLGLAIVKRLIDMHGGRIEVESTPDMGSTFSVWLPMGGRA